MDPCSPLDRPWDTAKHHYTIEDDGLLQPWFGRVWCNPPYGKEMNPFLERMVIHNEGIVLIFARTETKAFFDYVWDRATAILFIRGRLKFYLPNGKEGGAAGSPSVLIAYGDKDAEILRNCAIQGKFIDLRLTA